VRINLKTLVNIVLLAGFCLMVFSPVVAHAQSECGARISVGILPFDDASGAGISEANVAVLARQLQAQLIRSGRFTPWMLALALGTALPLDAEQASELGWAAKADFVVAQIVTPQLYDSWRTFSLAFAVVC
jgi:hypothetical protein